MRNPTRVLITLLICPFALLSSACNRAEDAGGEPAGEAQSTTIELNKSEWMVTTIDGRPRLPGSNVTATFDTMSVGGYSGCNWYGGNYTASGNNLDVEQVASTARACMSPEGIMEQEQQLFRTLERVASYRASDGRLEMLDSSNAVVLVLARRTPLAMNPADLVGTRWILHSVNDTVVPPSPVITLNFTATETSGFGGCRDYRGTYFARDDKLSFTSTTMLATECNRGRALQLREEELTTDLSETTHYKLTSDSLVLYTSPGDTVVFRANR